MNMGIIYILCSACSEVTIHEHRNSDASSRARDETLTARFSLNEPHTASLSLDAHTYTGQLNRALEALSRQAEASGEPVYQEVIAGGPNFTFDDLTLRSHALAEHLSNETGAPSIQVYPGIDEKGNIHLHTVGKNEDPSLALGALLDPWLEFNYQKEEGSLLWQVTPVERNNDSWSSALSAESTTLEQSLGALAGKRLHQLANGLFEVFLKADKLGGFSSTKEESPVEWQFLADHQKYGRLFHSIVQEY